MSPQTIPEFGGVPAIVVTEVAQSAIDAPPIPDKTVYSARISCLYPHREYLLQDDGHLTWVALVLL